MVEKIDTKGKMDAPKIKDVNILFTICMMLFALCGEVIKRITPPTLTYEEKMLSITAAQICFVFLPTILFVYIKRLKIKKVLKLNGISIINAILSSGLMLFAIPVTVFLNFIWIVLLQYFGKAPQPITLTTENIYQLLINLTVIGVVPALFEELLFRGVIMKGYERIGKVKMILMTSLLFALMHRDIQSLLGTFLLGIVIAYIVYRTKSIFSGMIAHFTNNGLAVILTYLIYKLTHFLESVSPEFAQEIKRQTETNISIIPAEQIVPTAIFLGSIAIIFTGIFAALVALFNHTTRKIERENTAVESVDRDGWAIELAPGFLVVVYIYYTQLI